MKTSVKDKTEMKLPGEVDFSKGIRGRFYRPHKVSTTIRIDDDVLLLFKKLATKKKAPYQTLMNEALRQYAEKSA
ncbi:MAG: BrnA antitoxin family protein [Thermodesulfovibrionales bacterium]